MRSDHIGGFKKQGLDFTVVPNSDLTGKDRIMFNATMVEWKGVTWLAYRRYDPRHGRMNIALTELNDKWMPTGFHHIPTLPSRTGDERWEDARLFVHNDRLWMSCTEIAHGNNNPRAYPSQRLWRLGPDFEVDREVNVMVGTNFGGRDEKNWIFFSEGGKLYFIYEIKNMLAYEINDETGAVVEQWKQKDLYWRHGHMRGGTNCVKLEDGRLLKFLHACTPTPYAGRRYSMSGMIFEPEPPFKIHSLSDRVVAYGSREEDFCGSGNGQCVFPMGLIIRNGKWNVSAGVNDTFNVIFHLDPAKIMAGMRPAHDFYNPKPRYFLASQPKTVPFVLKPGFEWKAIHATGRKMEGIMKTEDPIAIGKMLDDPEVAEITEAEFNQRNRKIPLLP